MWRTIFRYRTRFFFESLSSLSSLNCLWVTLLGWKSWSAAACYKCSCSFSSTINSLPTMCDERRQKQIRWLNCPTRGRESYIGLVWVKIGDRIIQYICKRSTIILMVGHNWCRKIDLIQVSTCCMLCTDPMLASRGMPSNRYFQCSTPWICFFEMIGVRQSWEVLALVFK